MTTPIAAPTVSDAPLGLQRGSVREVALLALPVVLQNLSVTTLHVVDSAMVGLLGPTELGGVGYGGIWIWTALCFFLGTGVGVQTFVSQAHGAGRFRQCGRWVWQALALVVPITIGAIACFAWGFPFLLEIFAPAEELRGFATEYVQARSFGAPAIATAMILASFFRGLGDMRTPLVGTVAANLLNAGLDYGLIFGHFGLPRLGVTGAGLATALSEWLYAAILIAAFLRKGMRRGYATEPARPELASLRRFLRTGSPIGGQWFLDMITFALFTTLIARMGSDSMAASQAFVVLLHISFMQVIGIQIAASTLVGRYMGAQDLAAAERSYRSALKLGIGFAGVVGILFLSIPNLLLRLFLHDASVLVLGGSVLAVGAAFQFFDAVGIIASGALRGAGDTRWPFLAQTAMAWGLFLPLGYLGGITLEGGLTGAWAGATLYVVVLGATLILRFRSGAWKAIRI